MPPRGSETSPSDAALALADASESRFRRFLSFFLRFFSFFRAFLAFFFSFFFSFFLSFFRRFLSPLDDDDEEEDESSSLRVISPTTPPWRPDAASRWPSSPRPLRLRFRAFSQGSQNAL